MGLGTVFVCLALVLYWPSGISFVPSLPLVGAQVVGPPSSGDVDASLACQSLQRRLSSGVVAIPGDPEYNNGTRSAWNQFNNEFLPACIVFPREASHVQEAMKTIYEHGVDYAVQAGGHSAVKGWNNVQNGILILFTFMDSVSYEPQRGTITLLPGVRWGDAINTLEPFGVAPVGGRVNSDVGTGLLLGGGLSFLSPKHGFGADTFVELDIVLVDGRLVTATVDNEYGDLFKAMKGGANRLGIVTRYEVTAIRTGTRQDRRWFGGVILYPEIATDDLLHAVAEYIRDTDDPNAASLTYVGSVVMPGTRNITTIPVANIFYNGGDDNLTAEETERLFNKTFSRFLSLPRSESSPPLGPMSYADITELLAESPAQQRLGQYFGASAFGSDDSNSRYLDAFQKTHDFTGRFRDLLNSTILAFTPVLDHQIKVGRRRGGNVIDPPLGGYNAVQFQVSVDPEAARSHDLAELNAARAGWFER
ncbi:hypothetical protein PQX77_013516 [Marasmius sp. AFHP31]|nr:hypothetical protein PQX77_013516 [Marasmius sp. AFHP31]